MQYRIIDHARPLPYPTVRFPSVPNRIAWYCFTCKYHTSHLVKAITCDGTLHSAICEQCGNTRSFTHTTISTETLKESTLEK